MLQHEIPGIIQVNPEGGKVAREIDAVVGIEEFLVRPLMIPIGADPRPQV